MKSIKYRWLGFYTAITAALCSFLFIIGWYTQILAFDDKWPYLIFAGGLLVSLGIGEFFLLWKISKNNIFLLEGQNKRLKNTQFNLSTSLKFAGIGTWKWDKMNNRLDLDQQAEALFGFDYGTFSGSYDDLVEKIFPKDRTILDGVMRHTVRDQKLKDLSSDVRVIYPNGTISYLTVKGQPLMDDEGKPDKIYGSVWNVSEIRFAHQRLEISQEVIRVLNEAASLKEATIRILTILKNYFGSEVGVIWKWNKSTLALDCAEIAFMSEVQTEEFKEINRPLIGQDPKIANHVMFSFRPFSSSNLDEYFPQKEFIINSQERLQGVIAFPFFSNTAISGVVEIFKRSPYVMKIDEGLENLMMTVGVAFGDFIQKMESYKIQKQFSSIITHSSDALFLIDPEGIIKSWNYGGERITGYTFNDIVESHITLFLSDEEKGSYETILESILQDQVIKKQIKIIKKGGHFAWVRISIAPIKDEFGKIIYGSVVMEDITKEKEAELLIRQNNEKLKAIINSSEEWIWELNLERLYTYSSPGVTKILGYEPKEILYIDFTLLIFPEKQKEIEEKFAKHIQEKRGWRKQILRWRHKDGTERWLESNAEPTFDETGKIVGFCGSDSDITENLYAEQSKAEFISLVSHELRTPLTSIHGSLGLILGREKVPDKVLKLLQIAYRNSSRLTELINNLLDIQRFQYKKFSFPLRPVNIANALKESIDSVRPVIAEQSKEIIVQEPLPQVAVNGDHEHLLQLIGNLLSNAIKFSPKNSKITVSHEIRGDRIRVSIADEGKGIPKEFQPKIFNIFERAETGDACVVPGTGLGLKVCKNIVEYCNGTLGFESKESGETTFYFELPISKEEG